MYKKLRYGLLTLLAFVGLTANAQGVTFDFDNDYATLFPIITGVSNSGSGDGAIPQRGAVATKDGFTVTVSYGDDPEKNANCIWEKSPRLRIYSGTLTISGSGIETIEFFFGNNNFSLATSKGTLEGNVWTSDGNGVSEVAFYIPKGAGSTQLKSLIINGEIAPVDAQEVTIAQFLARDDSDTDWYQLTGTVTSVKDTKNGYFYIEDTTGSVYVYGFATAKGGPQNGALAACNVEVGDFLTLIGHRKTYTDKEGVSTDEVTSAYFVSVEKGQSSGEDEPTEISVAGFLEKEESSTVWYKLTGTIKNLKDGDQYGNFDLDDGTGSVYVYGVRSEKGGAKKKFQELVSAYGIQNGGTITIIGNRGSFGGKDEVLEAYFVSYVAAPNPEEPVDPVTYEVSVGDALEIAGGLENNETTYDYYQVTGFVVGTPKYTKEDGTFTGGVYLYVADTKDGEPTLYIYNAWDENGEKFKEDGNLSLFAEGDRVVFIGKLQKYIDKENNTILELTKGHLVEVLNAPGAVSVEIPSSGLATFCTPYAIEIEGQDVFIVKEISEAKEDGYEIDIYKAQLEKLETGTIVAGGVGLIVKGSGTVSFNVSKEVGVVPEGNLLVGTISPKTVQLNEVCGLYEGAFCICNAGEFPAGKAYLPNPYNNSGAKILIDFSGTTGINEVKAQNESSAIYTIGGVRVKNAQQKGVYIINGKKVVK